VIVDTPQEYEGGLDMLRTTVRDLAGAERIDAVAVGIAGTLSQDKRGTSGTPDLHWGGKSLAGDIESLLETKVHIENDVALVGLGEAVAGAGSGASIVVYLTVSTGVNGVRIVDGSIDRSAQGFEIGGQYMTTDESRQTLEDMISGTAIQTRFGKKPREIEKDNPVWEVLAGVLAVGLHNTILHWSPNTVVLGGSMFNEVGISVPRVQERVQGMMKKFPVTPAIVHSSLGDIGGLHGGLELLKQRRG
jgi:predicted NBD/HSP70 family sugar kinase